MTATAATRALRAETSDRDAELVRLRDGSTVLIRPVRASDAALLADGFARLSPDSRRFRFLAGKDKLTPGELRYFTDVDHDRHEAIGALDPADGRGVGVGRYIRSMHDPRQAELAVTVIDEWQGRGVATAVLTRLAARASAVGIRTFTALVAIDNLALTGLLRRTPGVELVEIGADALEYEISLARFG